VPSDSYKSDPAQVAVVIPTYNCARYLARALDSVTKQTYRNFQIIVIDDGSTDNTDEIVGHYSSQCVFEKQVHAGPAAARNRGIRISSNPYIAFLDADDVWFPQKLERQIELLERRPEVGLVCSDCAVGSEKGRDSSHFRGRAVPQGEVFERLVSDCFIFTPTVVLRRECLRDVVGFNEALAVSEDLNLWLKIASRWAIAFIPEVLAVRYSRPDNLSATTSLENACANGIDALEDVLRSCPQLNRRQQRAVKRDLAVRHYNYGSFLLSSNTARASRTMLLAGWRYRPRNWRALAKYCISFLPPSLRASLITIRQTSTNLSDDPGPKSYSRFTDT
jgi:glycosyltransferase involved in cell wall biosynthesis